MSNLNSWEDDPAAQEENLAQQTQQLNLGNQNQAPGGSFRPGASSFTPGAAAFNPGQPYGYNQYQQGGYYGNQQQQQQQYYSPYGGQQGYQQYGQGPYGNVYGQGQAQYNQGYGQQYAGYQQQQQPQAAQQAPTIAQRPNEPAPHPAAPTDGPKVTLATKEGGAKVLSIGGDEAKPKTKVLSIGATAPKKTEKEEAAAAEAEEGAKVTASKAIEKTGEKTGSDSASGGTSPTPSSGRSSPSRAPGASAAAAAAAKTAARDASLVTREQTADVDEAILKTMFPEQYGKENMNIIFIGHVDAGKSTLGGAILVQTGEVKPRDIIKFKEDAKAMGRPTWWLSYALDSTFEERSKGKTVEVGRGHFEFRDRKYSILDAPGHKTYVPSMIGGASQADVGILVISARKGEYETGFEKGGQTREHAMLAKTQGVNKLVVAVNKMDDPTVEWSEERYKECTTKLTVFLRGLGYNPNTDVFFMPVAAQEQINIADRIPEGVCPWYSGPSLLEYLASMPAMDRKLNAPFMMAVAGKYRDMGTIVEGRVEAGVVQKGMGLIMMPNKVEINVTAVYGEQEDEIPIGQCGDQVRMRLRGIEEEDIMPGFVLCSPKRLVHCVKSFEAQIRILDLKSILSAGFNCVLHVHAAIEEVTFSALLHSLEKGTNRRSKRPPTHAKTGDSIIARMEVTGASGAVCIERFEDYPQMGRFTLRDQGQTIAIGKVINLITEEA